MRARCDCSLSAIFFLALLLAISDYPGVALLIPPDVLKQIAPMPETDRARIIEALQAAAADLTFRQAFVTEIVGQPGVWRLRKGNWRAIYEVVEGDVVVTRVAHRREAY